MGKNNEKSRFLMITVLIVCCAHIGARDSRADETPSIGTQVGQMYPDFYLPKLDGGFGRLSDFRGQKVLLIHFASW